jgi:hypothetical protein
LATPGFLENGIDFKQLVLYYLANNHYVEITDPKELALAIKLMEHVIGTSIGYKEDPEKLKAAIPRRFQMIFNSTQEELTSEEAGLIKRSNAVWLLTGSYEKGTDFQSHNGKQIEAKVYYDWNNMLEYAEKGTVDYTVFHGADYVLCYLINSYDSKHWYWLKKINNVYSVYYEEELNSITIECLPSSIPICYCRLREDKLIIGKNTFCV